MRKQFIHWIFLCLALVSGSVVHAQKQFKLNAGTYRGALQWQQSFDKINWSNIAGATEAILSVTPNVTVYYRAKISEPDCDAVYTDIKAVLIAGHITRSAKSVKGKVILPPGSTVPMKSFTAFSIIDSCKVNDDGSFELLLLDSTSSQTLFVTNAAGEICLLGDFVNNPEKLELTAESSAMALLVLYPLLKSVTPTRKEELKALYHAQPEFDTLKTEVAKLISEGKKIFAKENNVLAQLVINLTKKDFNAERYRTTNTGLLFNTSGSTVTFENLKDYSYSVSIKKDDGTVVLPPFILAGKLLKEQDYLQIRFPGTFSITPQEINNKRTFDLKQLGGNSPGRYIFTVRSGMAFDDSPEDNKALKENTYELIVALLDNFGGVLELQNNECRESFFNFLITAVRENVTTNASSNVITDVIVPYLEDASAFLGDCFDKPGWKFFSKLLYYVDLVINKSEYASMTRFGALWPASPSKIDYCQYLGDDFINYGCTVIQNLRAVGPKNYTGDTVLLKFKTIYDPKYEPSPGEPSNNDIVILTSTEGGGVFLPVNKTTDKIFTDANGEATVKWLLPCAEIKHVVEVNPIGNTNQDKKFFYTTNSFNPSVQVAAQNTSQTGEPSKKLSGNLVLKFKDVLNGSNEDIAAKNFRMSWRNIKGSGKIESTTSLLYDSSFSWTLGPEGGEQIVEATIKSKNCDWLIQDSIILFKATTALDTLAIIQSQTWKSTESVWMGYQLGSWNDLTEQTVCGDLSYQMLFEEIYTTFDPSGNFKWSFKGGYKGDSLANESSCQIVQVEWNRTESIPLAWKWEYIPSLKIIRVNNTCKLPQSSAM
jgi:hypothetical protein